MDLEALTTVRAKKCLNPLTVWKVMIQRVAVVKFRTTMGVTMVLAVLKSMVRMDTGCEVHGCDSNKIVCEGWVRACVCDHNVVSVDIINGHARVHKLLCCEAWSGRHVVTWSRFR